MDEIKDQTKWDMLSYEEKNHQLFLKQKTMLEMFLERGAISKEQFEKSLYDHYLVRVKCRKCKFDDTIDTALFRTMSRRGRYRFRALRRTRGAWHD